MYFDFHCHLNSEKADIEYLNYLKKNNIFVINVWINPSWDYKAFLLWKLWYFYSFGLHPSEVIYWNYTSSYFEYLKNNLIEKKANALWECGIDLHYEWSYEKLNEQKKFFYNQILIAQELNLTLIVHSRKSANELFDILKNFKNIKIYFHCWTYDEDTTKKFLNYFENAYFWFAMNIIRWSFKRVIKLVPLDKLWLETDYPYLYVDRKYISIVHLYYRLAWFLWIDFFTLKNKLYLNFKNLFDVWNTLW